MRSHLLLMLMSWIPYFSGWCLFSDADAQRGQIIGTDSSERHSATEWEQLHSQSAGYQLCLSKLRQRLTFLWSDPNFSYYKSPPLVNKQLEHSDRVKFP